MNYRVLLVEDDAGDAALVRAFLPNATSLTHVTTLAEAVGLTYNNVYDIALVDSGLPDAQGSVAIEALLRVGSFPVILLTGLDNRELGEVAARAGAQGYLVKGQFAGAQLERTIVNAICRTESILQYRKLLMEGPDAVLLLDSNRRVLFANAAACHLFEIAEEGILGTELAIPLTGEAIQEFCLPNGLIMEMHVATIVQMGQPGFLIMMRDVSLRIRLANELAVAKQELEEISVTDPLTGVMNRRGIESELMQCINQSMRGTGRISAILIDCDNFKSINDRFGYRAGDATLQLVAKTVGDTLRAGDRLSRIGGDEFFVLLPQTTVAEAFFVANKIRNVMLTKRLPISSATSNEDVTISLGVASIPVTTASLNEAVALTESALLISKRSGKNQANVVDDTGFSESAEDDVRGIVNRGESIRIFSQAIIDPHAAIIGYELLMRGPLNTRFEFPNDFFISARTCNILGVSDLLCLRRCIEASRKLPSTARVHVNLFPTTALDTPLEELLKILSLPHSFQLVLEINEQEFLGNSALLRPAISALKKAGVLIALDDVGFG
uniref:sensor domain-containing diguanylate cyclase n=1 Tax=Undibacterium sp. TaxID=1914977 RepID=UPI003750B17E